MDVIQDASPLWASAPPVVESIFTNLTAKELNSCARVCSLWNRVAQCIKKRRTKIAWYFYDSSEENRSSEVAFADYVCNLSFEPNVALIFRTERRRDAAATAGPSLPYPESSNLLTYLPLSCRSLFCCSNYITGTTSDCQKTKTIHKSKGEALGAVFFPKCVEIYMSKLVDKGCENLGNHMGIRDDMLLKCFFILLSTDSTLDGSFHLLEKLMADPIVLKSHDFAICGLIADHICLMQRNILPEKQDYCVGITGNNIFAASVVISETDHIESKLKEFFLIDELKGQCVAFSFWYFSRNRHYDFPCDENAMFRKLFPSIPLFSMFGLGRFGWDFSTKIGKRWNSVFSELFYFHRSSVFVVISLKS